jgi:hypothetical protein
MRELIFGRLKPVKARQQSAFLVRTAVFGLCAAAVIGACLAVLRLATGMELSPLLAAIVLAAGPLGGILAGLLLRRSWHGAACAVDAHYQLKDRSVTALAFLEQQAPSELHQLQLADAAERLRSIEPRQVVPLKAPRALPIGLAVLGLAIVGLAWPMTTPQAEAALLPPPDHVLAVADNRLDMLNTLRDNLEEAADNENDKDVLDLVKNLEDKTREMKRDGTDEKEALVKLSEQEAAVQAQLAALAVLSDGQAQSIGNALMSAKAFEGAGKAMMDGKTEKAAQELEKVENPEFTPKEARDAAEQLKKVAKELGDSGLGSLSTALSDLADSVKGGGGSKAKAISKVVAKELEKQARKKKLKDLLARDLENLKDCKCNCNCNNLTRGLNPQKSTSPSSNFGVSTSGNVFGEKTKLLSTRNQMELTGNPNGEGPSDTETTSSPEAREQAARGYKDKYQKYKKESEAVLESEQIPLGQRQMIRKYFESIRPANEPVEKK